MKNIFFIIILISLPLTMISQTPFIKPSWDLSVIEPIPEKQTNLYTNMIETDNGFYVVPLLSVDEYRGGKSDCAEIIVIDQDGEIIKKILLEYGENYIVNNVVLDIWNDTINIFTHLIGKDRDHALIMHNYLYDNFALGKHKEISRNDFGNKVRTEYNISRVPPLIDREGNRTMFYRYVDYPVNSHSVIDWCMIKFDSELNLVSKKEYIEIEDLECNIFMTTFTYNADSSQYYMVSYRYDYPCYYFMNVFDMELNLMDPIPFESNPPINLQGFNGNWAQNPYDGKIYAIGDIIHPNIIYEICAFKIDVENGVVKMNQFTNTPSNHMNNIVHGNNLCFLPNGDILGLTIWDIEDIYAYKPDAYYAYIPVFDTNMKKKCEWFYSKGKEYNQLLSQICHTRDDGVILLGEIRYKKDNEIFTEPYIVKFPASAFDTENIEEAHAHGLHLAVAYPNPGGDVLNIRCGLRNAILQVYDINGRKIHEEDITDDVTSVDASGWQSGTYIWKLGIRNEELGMKEVETGKWVK